MEEQILRILLEKWKTSPSAAKEITQMVMEFNHWVNWENKNDDFHFIKDHTNNTWMNADENMRHYDDYDLFQYWFDNIKNKKP